MRRLRIFEDGSYIAAHTGRIDDFCISIFNAENKVINTPKDAYCFEYFLSLQNNEAVFEAIKEMAEHLGKDEGTIATVELPSFNETIEEKQLFAAFAAMMVAEENRILIYGRTRIPTKVGKKIKIVGAYQVLMEGMSPQDAANWSIGKNWQLIAAKYDEIIRK